MCGLGQATQWRNPEMPFLDAFKHLQKLCPPRNGLKIYRLCHRATIYLLSAIRKRMQGGRTHQVERF